MPPDLHLRAGDISHWVWRHGPVPARPDAVWIEVAPPLWRGHFGADGFVEDLIVVTAESAASTSDGYRRVQVYEASDVRLIGHSSTGTADLKPVGTVTVSDEPPASVPSRPISTVVLDRDLLAFHFYDGQNATAKGRFLTDLSSVRAIGDLGEAAVKSLGFAKSGNRATMLAGIIVPAGEVAYTGPVAGGSDGMTQIYVKRADALRLQA